MIRLVVLICFALAVSVPVAAQERVNEDFASGALNWDSWCPCLINMTKAPITFVPDAGNYFAQIVADENSLGGNVCRRGSPHYECRKPGTVVSFVPDEPPTADENAAEPLGPSFIVAPPPPAGMTLKGSGYYCTSEVMQHAIDAGEEDECIQRQELQFQKTLLHEADKPYLYSFRFRMPGPVEDREHSIRWIIAQWKQEPVNNRYEEEFGPKWGPSPFLAQRFDDGVLHVTVQDEHCRCMVASAPMPNGSKKSWQDGPAQFCLSTRPGDPEDTACVADLTVEYGDDPVLTSPVDNWTEMRYRVQAGRQEPSTIEVYQDDRFIVRVRGKVGYELQPDEPAQTRFKIGHYRDYMPTVDLMDIDWVKREALPN